jgi:glutathione S-transferase
MDSRKTMYELKGNGCTKYEIIKAILKLKSIPFTETKSTTLGLITRENLFTNAPTIILYLDARYPIPELISGTPLERAQLCQAATFIHDLPKEANALARIANPFVFGAKLTLLDLLIWAYTDNLKFKQFMDTVINAELN